MPRITPVHWKVLDRIFKEYGYKFVSKKGSHRKYKKPGRKRPVIIPEHSKDVRVEIIMDNLETACMSREEYFELLDRCK